MKTAPSQRDEIKGNPALPQAQGRGASVIVAHLRAAILGGTYTVGDRLPPERDIARALGASRTTIRNALRLLEDDDLVTRKAGSGTYVAHDSRVQYDDIAEITSPLELVEVRSMIEPQVVRLAVRNGKPRDLDLLWEAVVETERAGSDVDQFSRCDQHFHLTLAETAHNPLIVWIFHQMNRIRRHRHWVAVQYKILTPARIAAYNAEHRQLAEAISVRDVETAVDIMQRHLQSARMDLLGVRA
jgi:DNA-binding FadR family transcriptional regulator